MTGKEIGHYVLAAVLVLATVPLYRYIIERAHDPDTEPAVSPQPVAVVRMAALQPVLAFQAPPSQPFVVGHVECIRGILYRQSSEGTQAVVAASGGLARCEIQAVPVRPDSSRATE